MFFLTFKCINLANALVENKTIKILDLSNCNLSESILSILFERLKYNSSLEEINFFNNQNINYDTMNYLITFLV